MFSRSRTRDDLIPRRVRVHAVTELTGSMRRTTFRDADANGAGSADSSDAAAPLAALRAPGPEDHVKVFLPDPATGELHAPSLAADGGLQRPGGVVSISRDMTVRATRTTGGVAEVDVDWVLHDGDGPASAWAARASVGDEVVLAGPRTSVGVPDGVERLTVVVDETGLPAAARWVDAVPDVPVTAIVQIGDDVDESFVEDELGRASVEILYRTDGPGQVADAVRSLGGLGDGEFLVALGEAGDLVPVRRYLRRELGLPPEQLSIAGYWRRGTVNLDHEQPLDPSDPD